MAAASSSRSLRRVCIAALMLAPAAFSALAQEAPPSSEEEREEHRLEAVRREIQRLQASLAGARREESTLLGDLQRLDLELALHRRQIQLVEADLSRCRSAITATTLQVARLRADTDRSRRILSARLRAMYIAGPLAFARVALAARNPAEVVEAYQTASELAESDGERIRTYRADLARLQAALAGLQAQKAELLSLRGQELARRRELEASRADRSRLLTGVRKEAEDRRSALGEMVETEKALQRLVQTLASGEKVPTEWKVGFEKFRGLLPWPAPGKVLVPFGAQKTTKFDTKVPHPGLDISVSLGQPVRAVFDGVVAFSDWFKGYGNLVILEHGGGFMTVYAHGSERKVATGDRVVGGQVIALGGDTGSLDGPKLYFEIWRDGKPEDPVAWLTRR